MDECDSGLEAEKLAIFRSYNPTRPFDLAMKLAGLPHDRGITAYTNAVAPAALAAPLEEFFAA